MKRARELLVLSAEGPGGDDGHRVKRAAAEAPPPTAAGFTFDLGALALFLPACDAVLRHALCCVDVDAGVWFLGQSCRAWRSHFQAAVREHYVPYMDRLFAAVRARFGNYIPVGYGAGLPRLFHWPPELDRFNHEWAAKVATSDPAPFQTMTMYRPLFLHWAAHHYPAAPDEATLGRLQALIGRYGICCWATGVLLTGYETERCANPEAAALWQLSERHPLLTAARLASISLNSATKIIISLVDGLLVEEAFCFLLFFATVASLREAHFADRFPLALWEIAKEALRGRTVVDADLAVL